MTQNASIEALKQKIVDGLAVLTGEGCMDGSGHLSVRIPGTDTFLINPRFAGALADAGQVHGLWAIAGAVGDRQRRAC